MPILSGTPVQIDHLTAAPGWKVIFAESRDKHEIDDVIGWQVVSDLTVRGHDIMPDTYVTAITTSGSVPRIFKTALQDPEGNLVDMVWGKRFSTITGWLWFLDKEGAFKKGIKKK